VRILHTSDWHLGSRFYGRTLISDQAYVLDQMINLVRDLNPDVMVVAGDVFDHRRPGDEALALFHDTIGRLLDLGTVVVILSGPTDDLGNLHLNARWVRQQGLYLYSDPSQVLSPLTLRGARDNFSVNLWCMPYARPGKVTGETTHPAQAGRSLVETVVQRIDPGAVNLFVGYAWAQGIGKRAELGSLVSPGGLPIEKRFLEYFDYSALGGCHEPISLGPATLRYSGGLLATDLEQKNHERSVTFVVVEDKSHIVVDEYPLRPRRAFRVLSGSVEELMRQGQEQRTGDLLVLRSRETELTVEQKARLRTLGSNIVSVETESPLARSAPSQEELDELSPLLRLVVDFYQEVGGAPLEPATLQLLRELEGRL
jgi:exonuclease SbcD